MKVRSVWFSSENGPFLWNGQQGPDTLWTCTCSVHMELHVQDRPPSTSSASDYRQLTCKWAMFYSSSYRNGMWLVARGHNSTSTFTVLIWHCGSEDDTLQGSNLSTLKNQMIAWWSNNASLQTACRQFQYFNHCGKSKTNNGHRWWHPLKSGRHLKRRVLSGYFGCLQTDSDNMGDI